jgi:cell division septation protein DedD
MADRSKDPTLKISQVSPPTTPGMQTIDQPLSSLRRRHQRRRGLRRGGLRGFALWALVGLIGLVIVAVIAAPLVYRSLRPEYRERIKHYAPFMAAFDPQREYTANTLPTVAPAEGAGPSAADLLLTPDVIVPAAALAGEDATPTPGEDNVIVITATPLPVPTDVPQPTALPTEAPTEAIAAQPTATWTPLPSPTSAPATQVALLPSARLYGFTHVYQTWNNCGPATLTMGLSYFGWSEDQSVAANFLKPDPEDKNVSPWQMVRFVNENTGVRALYRFGGDMDRIKALVLEGFPVIVETGYMPEGYDWMGHYRLIIAYDDSLRQFYVYDSFLGHGNFQGLPADYNEFDRNWQHFNRTYIVLYEQSRENELRGVLGDDADLTLNWQHALEVARQEATASPDNPFAWFNMGTSYVGLGMYEDAARAYDQARNAGSGLPWRMLWYQFGPFQAYYEIGRYDDVLALVQANLGTTPYVEETYYWTGMVYMARQQYAPARSQFNLALQHNRNYDPAREALAELDQVQASAGS